MLCICVISSCGFRACFSREGRKLGQNTEEDNNEKGSTNWMESKKQKQWRDLGKDLLFCDFLHHYWADFFFLIYFWGQMFFNVVFKIQLMANAEVSAWKNRFSSPPPCWQFWGEDYLSSLYFKSILTFCDYEVTSLNFQCSYIIRNSTWISPCHFVSCSFPRVFFLELELTFMEAPVLSAGRFMKPRQERDLLYHTEWALSDLSRWL